MASDFTTWGLAPSVLRAFEEEEVDLKAALVLGDSAIARLIPKEGPRATFLAERKLYLEKHALPLPLLAEDQPIQQVQHASNSSMTSNILIEADADVLSVLSVPLASNSANVITCPTPTPGSSNAGQPANKKRKLCSSYVNEIDSLLDQSIEGQIVLGTFKKDGKPCNASRDQLVRCIIFSLFQNDYQVRLSTSLWQEKARNICEVFPTESELTYFSRHRRNNKLVVNGRLVVKYHNLRRKLIAVGFIERASLEEELQVEEEIDYVDIDLEEDEDLRWLSANSRPWPDVLSAWERTFVTRMRLVKGLKSKKPVEDGDEPLDGVITTVPRYLCHFRALTTTYGWELLLQDFNSLHAGKAQALTSSWTKIISFAKGKLPSKSVQFLESQELSYDQKATELLVMFNQLFKIRNVTTPKGSWKVSRLEVQRSFVLHAETEAKWKTVVNDRRECLAKQGLTLQPYLVFIGPLHTIKKWKLVYSDKAWWDFDSPLQALDVAFKAFFSTDAGYPDECRHIWTFLQRSIYDMKLPSDFSTDKSLKAYLAADLKEFSNIQV